MRKTGEDLWTGPAGPARKGGRERVSFGESPSSLHRTKGSTMHENLLRFVKFQLARLADDHLRGKSEHMISHLFTSCIAT